MKKNQNLDQKAPSSKGLTEIVGTLKKSTIFGVLSDEDLIKISPLFTKVAFRDGEYIFMEDEPSDWLYIVSRKRVKIINHTHSGRDFLLEIKAPGEIFCCAAVLDNKPYPESAQAKGDASVLKIGRKKLLGLIDSYAPLKVGIMKYLDEKLTDAYDMMKNITTEIVERRIASLLLKLSEKAGTDDAGYRKINFSLTRQEIADMVGSTVETSIRVMSKFQKQKIVKSTGDRILIRTEGLRRLLAD